MSIELDSMPFFPKPKPGEVFKPLMTPEDFLKAKLNRERQKNSGIQYDTAESIALQRARRSFNVYARYPRGQKKGGENG